MDIKTVDVVVGGAIEVRLAFDGIATYKVLEYAEKAGGGWTLDKTLQSSGHSHDAQADNYVLTPVGSGAQRLIYIAANMSSVTGTDPVSMQASFFQGNNRFYQDTQRGTDDGSLVQLITRVIVKGA